MVCLQRTLCEETQEAGKEKNIGIGGWEEGELGMTESFWRSRRELEEPTPREVGVSTPL